MAKKDKDGPGPVTKEEAEEALDEVLGRDKYKGGLDDPAMERGDRLKLIADALSDVHLHILGTGRVSTTEAKNFRHFIKKEFEGLVKSGRGKGKVEAERAGRMLSDVVWSAYNAYVKFKLDQIDEIRKRKAARIQRILDRREKRR